MVNTIMRIAFVVLMFAEVGAVVYMVRAWKDAVRKAKEDEHGGETAD